MLRRKRRLIVESLESRRVLSGVGWFEDSGQELGANSSWAGTALGDLDGDGDLDAFLGCFNRPPDWAGLCEENKVWLNDGQGKFSLGWSAPTGLGQAVALGDLDGDGDLDAFLGLGNVPFASVHDIPNEVWLNDGRGNFSDTGQRLGRAGTLGVTLGDLDGDGDLDAVTANVVGRSKVWLNDGTAKFTDGGQDLGTNSPVVALGDLDGDDDLDAYVGQALNAPNQVWINDGQGNFSDSGQKLGRSFSNRVRLGDLDGDGDLDAFVANGDQFGTNQPNKVWLNDGLGHFTDSGQELGSLLSNGVGLADLDGDGDLDAFVANTGGNLCNRSAPCGQPNKVWLNNGAGNFSDSGQDLGSTGSVSVSLGDLDGDGDRDALVGSHRVANVIWTNVQLVAGDANRDGRFDQLDIIQVLEAGKYNTGEPADFSQGDFNRDGVFDQLDIIAALQTGAYLQG